MLSIQRNLSRLPEECIHHIIGYTYCPQSRKLVSEIRQKYKKKEILETYKNRCLVVQEILGGDLINSNKSILFLSRLYETFVYPYGNFMLTPMHYGYENYETICKILCKWNISSTYLFKYKKYYFKYDNLLNKIWALLSLEEITDFLDIRINDYFICEWVSINMSNVPPSYSWLFEYEGGDIVPDYENLQNFYLTLNETIYNNNDNNNDNEVGL
jgi:hypothetical protein